jgi:hypothetical protein
MALLPEEELVIYYDFSTRRLVEKPAADIPTATLKPHKRHRKLIE